MDSDQVPKLEQKAIIPGLKIQGVDRFSLVQNRILVVVILIAAGILFFPPWQATAPNGMTASVGHFFLFSGEAAARYKFPSIDYARLLLEVLAVFCVGVVVGFFKRPSGE